MLAGCLLTACKDYDDNILVDRDVQTQHLPVKTQFSISVSGDTNSRSMTRLASDACDGLQEGAFAGMKNICLIPFILDDEELKSQVLSPVPLGAVAADARTNLPQTNATPIVSLDNSIAPTTDKDNIIQFYGNVSIPGGTNAFLFYGESMCPDGSDGSKEKYGSLLVTMPTSDEEPNTENIGFDLEPVYSPASSLAIPEKAKALADYLTDIHNTEGWSSDDNKLRLETNIAGSSRNVLALIQSLYTVQNTGAIRDKIKEKATVDDEGILTFNEALLDYPSNIGLPDGAAYLYYNDDQQRFEPVVGNAVLGDVNDPDAVITRTTALTDFAYPARLYYYANSPVAVSEKKNLANIWDGTASWDNFINYDNTYAYASKGVGKVEGSVNSVALVNEITYAVARLELTIQAANSTLKDEQDNDVRLQNNGFPVTGVLVGSQRSVDFQFMPKRSAVNSLTVYDTSVADGMELGTDISSAFHTLLLPTDIVPEGTSVEAEEPVSVVVELMNNVKDFYGLNGQLIPMGCKFYLIGELKVNEGVQPAGGDVRQVFASNYTTKVHFNISSLKNAYNTVPDLQQSMLHLGLTIDLNWQKGVYNKTEIE